MRVSGEKVTIASMPALKTWDTATPARTRVSREAPLRREMTSTSSTPAMAPQKAAAGTDYVATYEVAVNEGYADLSMMQTTDDASSDLTVVDEMKGLELVRNSLAVWKYKKGEVSAELEAKGEYPDEYKLAETDYTLDTSNGGGF